MTCSVCHKEIKVEASGNSPGDHDPAYHVAQTYHRPHYMDEKYDCQSCHEDWPCPTIQEYS